MEKSSTSKLPNSLPRLPQPLETSLLVAPFLSLARLSQPDMATLFGQSRLMGTLTSAINSMVQPLHRRLDKATWLHMSLKTLHLICTFAVFVLATFASTELIALAVVASFLLLILRAATSPIAFRFNMIDGLVSLFFLTAVLSALFSSYTHTSLVGLIKFSVFFIGYVNFRVLIGENRSTLYWMMGFLVLLGMAESLIGFYQYINHVQPLATWQDASLNAEDKLTRIFGTLKPSNPNLLAGFLVPALAAGSGLTLKNLVKSRWWMALPFLGMTVFILGALVLTGSRGGYLAILSMGVATFLYLGHLLWHEPGLKEQYRLKALWILVLVGTMVAMAGAILGMPAIRNRFLSIFAMREDSSNSYRMNVWASTIEMIKDNWWIGIGPGNDTFKQVYGLYMTPGYTALSAYSIFLEIWAEQGILGILSFLLLFSICKMRSMLAFYSDLNTETKITIGFLFTGILGSIIYGLFDTIWYRPSVNLLFWLFVAGLSVFTEAALSKEAPHA
jgi:putative inorganic carbon (hco3(-)) transporter